MSQTTLVECHKCGGSGYIPHYAGIANGVCFTCSGSGKTKARKTKQVIPPLTPYQASLIEAITNGDLSSMSFGQLSKLRDAAHWPTPHCPNLLAIWRERGEMHFQAAQEEMLASL